MLITPPTERPLPSPPVQTHINDIMMKRYSKAKAAQDGGADLAAAGAWAA